MNEMRLVAFFRGEKLSMNVWIWDCFGTVPKPTRTISFFMGISGGIYVNKSGNPANFITSTESIQRIELGDETKFLDSTEVTEEYANRLSTVSRDGSRWVLVSYGRKDEQIQIKDLITSNASARFPKLERSQSDTLKRLTLDFDLLQCLSPGLSVLVINAEVFVITATKGDSPLVSFAIEDLPALFEAHGRSSGLWQCQFSLCTSYVVYVWEGKDQGQVLLFRIDIESRTSTQPKLDLPKRLVSPSAKFHSSLPLMTLSYGSPLPAELGQNRIQRPQLHLTVVELMNLEDDAS